MQTQAERCLLTCRFMSVLGAKILAHVVVYLELKHNNTTTTTTTTTITQNQNNKEKSQMEFGWHFRNGKGDYKKTKAQNRL